ncbi:hypothetical protein IPM62_00860 [Candidatus Woesebacteria bacterium]|nr:MAG: hypothetical protein IPM62_00860 [Candidatus Woesebacteria bacterium]
MYFTIENDPPDRKDEYDDNTNPPLEDETGHNYDKEDATGIGNDGSFITGDIETDPIRHSDN